MQTTARAPSTASRAEALNVTTALVPEATTLIGAGSVSTGPVPSVTVTVNEPVEVLPAASDDEQVTVVTPIGNDDAGGRRADDRTRAVDRVERRRART